VIGDQSRAAAIGQPGAGTSTAGRTTPAAETGASAAAAARAAFPDWRFAPNIGGHPGIYEIENRALDPDGHVLAAMRNLAPWDGRVIVDLGCGTGFWLPVYAADASRVIGVEPDPALRARAAGRTSDLPAVRVLPGSAEHLPLPDRSADVVHARFAYFLTPGGDAGLAEVLRVLRAGRQPGRRRQRSSLGPVRRIARGRVVIPAGQRLEDHRRLVARPGSHPPRGPLRMALRQQGGPAGGPPDRVP
jgi:SAM-dependent methyltransferase